MTILKYSILFFGLITACSNKVKQEHFANSLLLTSSAKEIYPADELEKLKPRLMHDIMSANFNHKIDTVKYLKDKIYVSCLMTAPGCAQYSGDIAIKDDTIRILLINKGDFVYRTYGLAVTYEIKNKQRKHFVFQK